MKLVHLTEDGPALGKVLGIVPDLKRLPTHLFSPAKPDSINKCLTYCR